MSRFEYLIGKIEQATFQEVPYKHLYINDLFTAEDFKEITGCKEIGLPAAQNDNDLFTSLYDAGYKIINFPGCITDQSAYLKWHQNRTGFKLHTACEGFGMTLRLFDFRSSVLNELNAFLAGEKFNTCLARRFGVEFSECTVDGGIQKYLDGYEISPHPDIRKKALTFMVNINPAKNSEQNEYHTHYLQFVPEREYVKVFWQGNRDAERCWVPWSWCKTVKQQRENNSMVVFAPSDDTVHGVKAAYNHLTTQRTQLYGNLWYKASPALRKLEWEDFEFGASAAAAPAFNARAMLGKVIPSPIKQSLKKLVSTEKGNVGVRKV